MKHFLVIAVVAASCKAPAEGTPQWASTARLDGGAAHGDSTVNTLFLTPNRVVPGQTSVGADGQRTFSYSGLLGPSATGLVESRAYFVDSAGTKIPAKAIFAASTAPPSLTISAVSPLTLDAWHWLVVEQDAMVRVAGAEKTPKWATHFFTGSAPRVVRVQGSTNKNPDLLNITLSEPINAATVDAATLLAGGGAKCVLRGALCMDRSQEFTTDNIDVRLTGKFLPATIAVTLAGSVSGSGRSVAAAQGMTGDSYSGSDIAVLVSSSAWRPCDDQTTYCWADDRPVPSP